MAEESVLAELGDAGAEGDVGDRREAEEGEYGVGETPLRPGVLDSFVGVVR